MKLIFSLVFAIISIAAIAQDMQTFKANFNVYDSLSKKAHSNKAWGIALSIIGSADVVAGATLMGISDGDVLNLAIGGAAIATGALATGLGTSLIIKGKKQYKAAQLYKPSAFILTPNIYTNPNLTGIGFGFSFRF